MRSYCTGKGLSGAALKTFETDYARAEAGDLKTQSKVVAKLAEMAETRSDPDFVLDQMLHFFRIAARPEKTGNPQERYVDFAFLREDWPEPLALPFIRAILSRHADTAPAGVAVKPLDLSGVGSLRDVEDEIIWRWVHCLIAETGSNRQKNWDVEYVEGDQGKAASLMDYGNPYWK